MIPIDTLREIFGRNIALREKRPGIYQLLAPFFHEDGDMVEIYLEDSKLENNRIRISDYGMSCMRLSYEYELDTPNKEKIFYNILSENGIQEENGNLFLETEPERICPSLLQFAQTIAKISGMRHFKREVIQSLFYEMLQDIIETKLIKYHPKSKFLPVMERDDLEVDWIFDIQPRPVYLFGVKDNYKARLVTISCLEFLRAKLPFRSYVVHEDFDIISRKDRLRLTSAVEKQFTSLDDFRDHGEEFLQKEIA